nr:ATP-binding cassette domain-containing protein [uncultured Cohaesibacter sp.]
MADLILALSDVVFSYGQQSVLSGVDLSVNRQSVVALMGPSGCGKTTLLSLILGLQAPSSGLLECSAGRVSAMFQDPLLLPWRNVLDNVSFALKAFALAREEREDKARRMLEAVGLPADSHQKFPHELSGGMRQRVSLARALVVEPDLLLLDEPFHALDFALVKQMQILLRSRTDDCGMAILMVSHDARHAAEMANEIVFLSSPPTRVIDRMTNSHRGDRHKELLLSTEIETRLDHVAL